MLMLMLVLMLVLMLMLKKPYRIPDKPHVVRIP